MKLLQKIETIKQGKPVIILDSEDRENEGDLMYPAEIITYKIINFMIQNAGGMICVPISKEISVTLNLPPMVVSNEEHFGSNLTVSADASEGISTGVSAKDKEKTIKTIASELSTPDDLVRPGHVFPIISDPDGIDARKGHTEMSIEICKILGYRQVAVIAELIDKDGEVLRGNSLYKFAEENDIAVITIDELENYNGKD